MDKKLLEKLVGDAIANANYKRMSNTGKRADEAREQLEELKALQKSIQEDDFGGGKTIEDEVLVNVEIPFSCVPLLNDALDKAIADCDKTIDGRRRAKKLLDIQIALMGGKNGK